MDKANDSPAKPVISLDDLCDGVQFFSSRQAAKYLDVGASAIANYRTAERLSPALIGRHPVYTLADLKRHKHLEATLKKRVFAELKAGRSPVDVVIDLDVDPEKVGRWVVSFAKLAKYWLVESPRGSYGRWLEARGLVELTPRQLRRVIELLVSDPLVQEKAALAVCSPSAPVFADKATPQSGLG